MDKNILEVLMYFVPAALVLMAAYMLIKKFLDNEYKIRLLEAKRSMQKDTIPLRFQAYERICMLLERISPNNLVIRTNKPGMNARELQGELLSTIRAEYEHNLSQQVYISGQSWELVKRAKEDTIRIINMAFVGVGENATAIDLSKAIFEIIVKNEMMPTQKALDYIKTEIKQIL
jgi:hypothetical protein